MHSVGLKRREAVARVALQFAVFVRFNWRNLLTVSIPVRLICGYNNIVTMQCYKYCNKNLCLCVNVRKACCVSRPVIHGNDARLSFRTKCSVEFCAKSLVCAQVKQDRWKGKLV